MQTLEKGVRKGSGCVMRLQRGKRNESFASKLLLKIGKPGALEPFNLCHIWQQFDLRKIFFIIYQLILDETLAKQMAF